MPATRRSFFTRHRYHALAIGITLNPRPILKPTQLYAKICRPSTTSWEVVTRTDINQCRPDKQQGTPNETPLGSSTMAGLPRLQSQSLARPPRAARPDCHPTPLHPGENRAAHVPTHSRHK